MTSRRLAALRAALRARPPQMAVARSRRGEKERRGRRILEGSFSAVSTRRLADKGSLERSRRDLQNGRDSKYLRSKIENSVKMSNLHEFQFNQSSL